jgi:hypothetical protein
MLNHSLVAISLNYLLERCTGRVCGRTVPTLSRAYASNPSDATSSETTHFGYRNVPKTEKENLGLYLV